MSTATNVEATAVNTISWLASPETNIVVPVYQRQYRWDIGACEQLLADIRAVADGDGTRAHFIGSILSADSGSSDELILIDGQQRITTLMLLIAALQHAVAPHDPALAIELKSVLVRQSSTTRTKLRPHRAWAATFENVVLERTVNDDARTSRFDNNYAYFRSQIRLDEVPRIWQGLRALEHVSITLEPTANAQQIFESLNSTGEPLRDHELIHNYVLMGLSHAEQLTIEDAYWLPIEANTGEALASFWRHYLVMATGREVAASGERGVYGAFRELFPQWEPADLARHAEGWRAFSEIYRVLLEPANAPDADVARHLRYLNTFGRKVYPLVMNVYSDFAIGVRTKDETIRILTFVQSMLLRRTVLALSTDRLVARLCRAYRELGTQGLEQAIARVCPSDDRLRVGLKYSELPHPGYVLSRLANLDSTAGLTLDHVVPLVPSPTWTGDGARTWSEYSDDEQNSHRALSKTLGNMSLLEDTLAERAIDATFPDKRDRIYARSSVSLNDPLARLPRWNTTAHAERTSLLISEVVRLWPRPRVAHIDDDGLTPILDAIRRRGWPRGWEREFAYVEYCGEHWEVPDVKYLFNRVFRRLWADSRDSVARFASRRGGPIYDARAWHGEWDTLDVDTHLYMGWDSQYMLGAVQGVLEEAGLAAEVFVKYSYIGDAMD